MRSARPSSGKGNPAAAIVAGVALATPALRRYAVKDVLSVAPKAAGLKMYLDSTFGELRMSSVDQLMFVLLKFVQPFS